MKNVLVLRGFHDKDKVEEDEAFLGETIQLSDARATELENLGFVKIISEVKKDGSKND